jgi:hypothetical protein
MPQAKSINDVHGKQKMIQGTTKLTNVATISRVSFVRNEPDTVKLPFIK